MEWFGTLKTLDLESYNTFLIYWFIACVLNAIYLHKSKELPLSNRNESQGMGVLGKNERELFLIGKELSYKMLLKIIDNNIKY